MCTVVTYHPLDCPLKFWDERDRCHRCYCDHLTAYAPHAVTRLKATYAALCAALPVDVQEKYGGVIHLRLRRKHRDNQEFQQVEVFVVAPLPV